MVTNGTGGIGSKWIRTEYPELSEESINLVPEESIIVDDKDGIEWLE